MESASPVYKMVLSAGVRDMIVDSHVYTFLPVDSTRGYSSREEHLAWVQASHAGHHQPAFRLRDRTPSPSGVLNPEGVYDHERLPDLDFRADHAAGRVVWTVDGEDHTKHYFPPNLRDLEFTPHGLISEMDYAGVDMALVHTDPMLVRESSYLAECLSLYPDRLRSMAPVDEWRIPSESDAVIAELTTAISGHGLHAVKFNTPLASRAGPEPWDGGPYRAFWDAASGLGVPVFFTLGTGSTKGRGGQSIDAQRQGYLDELATLMRWTERYPDVVCSLTHGFPWRVFLEGDRIRLPEAVWAPFANPRVSLEVCFPVRLGDLFDYPYREVWPRLQEMVERIGADRLMWGTDMPFQNRFCTYRQSRTWIERYCSFLTEVELASIMGGTAAHILGLDEDGR